MRIFLNDVRIDATGAYYESGFVYFRVPEGLYEPMVSVLVELGMWRQGPKFWGRLAGPRLVVGGMARWVLPYASMGYRDDCQVADGERVWRLRMNRAGSLEWGCTSDDVVVREATCDEWAVLHRGKVVGIVDDMGKTLGDVLREARGLVPCLPVKLEFVSPPVVTAADGQVFVMERVGEPEPRVLSRFDLIG